MKRSGALLVIVAMSVLGAPPQAARAQYACARPNVDATAIRVVAPDVPATAQQQGTTGTVRVMVSLDAQSRVTGTRILSSPSALLNNAALTAARTSTYQTAIRDCVPVATDYLFSVTFSNGNEHAGVPAAFVPSDASPAMAAGGSDAPTVVITATGVASRPPDVAYISAGILTNDDIAATATTKNNAIYDALKAKLHGLGVDDSQIKTAYYNVGFTARPTPPPPDSRTPAPPIYPFPNGARYGYLVTRQLAITVTAMANVGAVIDAGLAAGATTIGNAQYGLVDRGAAYQEALAAALKDAAGQAQVVASTSRMRLAGIKQIQVGQSFAGPPTPAPGPVLRYPTGGVPPSVATDVRPSPVEVRASVTVTYLLKPGT